MSWLSQFVKLFEPFMAWMSENETKFQVIKILPWHEYLLAIHIAFDIVYHLQKLDKKFHEFQLYMRKCSYLKRYFDNFNT